MNTTPVGIRAAGFVLFLSLLGPRAVCADLTAELVVDLQRVVDAALSPDGESVAYLLLAPPEADVARGRRSTEVWLVLAAGGEPRRFTSKPSASGLSWSPDGRTLSFLATRKEHDESRQVYALPVDGGEARPLTRHSPGVGVYRWSPDGSRIAFLAADEESAAEKEAREQGRDWIVNHGPRRFHRPWVLEIESGESRRLHDADLEGWDLAWTPDGSALVMQATDEPLIDASYMDRKLYLVPAAGGAPRPVCETPGKLGPMAVSPDGRLLAFAGAVSRNDPLAQSIFVVDLPPVAGASPTALPEPRDLSGGRERSVEQLAWLGEDEILALAVEGTATVLERVRASDGSLLETHRPAPILSGVDVRAGSTRIAAVGNAPDHPGELFVWDLAEDAPRRLTRSNPALAECRLAHQEVISWSAADGTRIEGILTYPLDRVAGRRYPLVLQIHGGPEGVSLNGWNTRATYPVQLIAARGFFVLEPNYRGSGGRGVAFSQGDHDDLGGAEFDDILAGIDHLVEQGLVDGDRVGTGGWSYGGYLSAWAATRHSERFRAAIVAAGIGNWISFSGTTDIPHEMALVHWNSYWYDHQELHWERSPLRFIGDAATPTLIAHGSEDLRVPPGQSMELYTALEHRGVPCELVRYPHEPHGLLERAHQLDFIERCLRWFERHVAKRERL